MATLPLKASRKEQRSVIYFLWAKRRCPNTIYSEMRPVLYMVTSVLQDQQYMFGVRSLLGDEKALLIKKDLAENRKISIHFWYGFYWPTVYILSLIHI